MCLEELGKAVAVKVKSVKDLVRMAATLAAMGQSTYMLRFMLDEKRVVYGLVAVFRDYFKYHGIPMFYYVVREKSDEDRMNYISAKSDEYGEYIEFSKGFRAGWVNLAIIDLEEPPPFIDLENLR